MNYILVRSTVKTGDMYFQGETNIDYYAESKAVTPLEAHLKQFSMVKCQSKADDLEAGFSYNYTVNMPPLAVLELLKKLGYKVVGTNTIGDTCIWTLDKRA